MRKLLTVAVAATATLALAAGAIADPNDSDATLTVKATPTDSGTAKKPKNVKLTFQTKVNLPGTTVEVIDVLLPKGLAFSGKGFKKCDIENVVAAGVNGCPAGSKAGPKGTANALVGPQGAPLNFDVYPFVESNTSIAFYLAQQGGGVQSAVHGKLTNKGRKMSITIPQELRQPGGLDATLTGLKQTFSGKSKGKYIVSSTFCKRRWKVGSKLTFATRVDGTLPPAPEAREVKVKCTK